MHETSIIFNWKKKELLNLYIKQKNMYPVFISFRCLDINIVVGEMLVTSNYWQQMSINSSGNRFNLETLLNLMYYATNST